MAINKKKNKLIQITFPHQEYERLEAVVDAFNKEGVKCSKSDILLASFQGYVKMLVANGLSKQELEELEKGEQDA